uniref:ORF7 protein n=1 Tax=Miniopterus bat coronavirus TaxID=3119327 RepID=A0AB38ZDM3_9NIDO
MRFLLFLLIATLAALSSSVPLRRRRALIPGEMDDCTTLCYRCRQSLDLLFADHVLTFKEDKFLVPPQCAGYLARCKPNYNMLLGDSFFVATQVEKPDGTTSYKFVDDGKRVSPDGYVMITSVFENFREHVHRGFKHQLEAEANLVGTISHAHPTEESSPPS